MLGHFLKPEYEELIRSKDWESLRIAFEELDPADIAEVLEDLPPEDSGVIFRILPRDVAGGAFEYLPLDQQAELVKTLGSEQLVSVLNEMAPDDRTRLLEELPAEVTKRVMTTLRPEELKVARQLLGYPEKSAGRYMTPEYLSIRPQMTAQQALEYIRKQGKGRETLNVLFVTDERGVLIGDLRLSDLVIAEPEAKIVDLQERPVATIAATSPREEVVAEFEKYDREALPVLDSRGVLLGIITIDDVLDVAAEEATEDIQRMGGMEALESPYLETGFLEMVRKRGSWLTLLFLGSIVTTFAMVRFQDQIAKIQVLTLFLTLIVGSGGNSGSQATALIIRALAVREVGLGDWWRVLHRELLNGLALGVLLGSLGVARVLLLPEQVRGGPAGPWLLGATVALSLVAVVLFGSVLGGMLPFILRRLGFDPATASTPFIATLCDLAGTVIYFSVASQVLL